MIRFSVLSPRSAASLTAIASFTLALTTFFAPQTRAQQAPVFTQVIVFGDSLSDDGNIRHRTNSKTGGTIDYPSGTFNYSDGRFTNSSDTDPASVLYAGVWHEQLARTFLGLPRASNSLGGGLNYAFGGATTIDGTSDRTVLSNPVPFAGGNLTITIDNIGRQIDNYLSDHIPDPNALYIVWGGGNDLFDDDSAANVTATVNRVVGLVNRLATAGARNFLVPNVPALGAVPNYADSQTKQRSLNAASAAYRGEFKGAFDGTISTFAAQGVTLNIYPLDIWLNFVRTLVTPGDYGFTNFKDSAQGRSSVNPDQYLFWDEIHPTTAGHYQTAREANRLLSGAIAPMGKALNLSTRVAVGSGANVAIAGFIVSGNVPKRMIVRALGPSLSSRGVSGVLPDPTLELHDSAGALLLTNDDWKQAQQAEIEATTLAPENDLESALVLTLAPGTYTAVVTPKDATGGIGLVEVYDLERDADSSFGNISTRGFVGTGDNAMIAGFIIGAGENPLVVVRAIGPSLTSANIADPLLDPTIELHDGNGAVIAFNDNWRDTQGIALKATTLAPTDDREAAIVASLPPGNYTAIVRGVGDTTGIALVEAYRVP